MDDSPSRHGILGKMEIPRGAGVRGAALEEVPANARLTGAAEESDGGSGSRSSWWGSPATMTQVPLTPAPCTPSKRIENLDEMIWEKMNTILSVNATDKVKQLRVYSVRDNRPRRVLHRVEKAG